MATRVATFVVHLAALLSAVLLVWAVGQPIFTDDVWWHLTLGRVFAEAGPWLDNDPMLFGAVGPPSTTSWLSDIALSKIGRAGGFTGLRILHVVIVAAITMLGWSLLRRASDSRTIASLGTIGFISLAAYRLVQLRPDLATILATLVFYRLLFEANRPPSGIRIALAAALIAAWTNAHAGFLLGPVLLVAAIGGLVLAAAFRPSERRRAGRIAQRLSVALVICGIASLVNPAGFEPHLSYFNAGADTPALPRVIDEWAPIDLLHFPVPTLPPSPFSWVLVWAISLGLLFTLYRIVRGWRAGETVTWNPQLLAISLISFVAMLTAVRFLWLGIFPLLWLATAGRGQSGERSNSGHAWLIAGASVLFVTCFIRLGPWPMISRNLPTTRAKYAQPYSATKYFGHAVWLLRDTRLSGNLYNDYFLGGFLGYWLAPDIRTFINGTLNVSNDTFRASNSIALARGAVPDEELPGLLDRFGIDLFLGIRLPQVGHPHRPWNTTTAHLERVRGWIPVFRNLRSSVFIRDNERNRDNLQRVSQFYATQGVPFDPKHGFDVEWVIQESPNWAIAHGIVPLGFRELEARASNARPALLHASRDRLATLYAVLGLYERALELDRSALDARPADLRARRRLVWTLLRLGRFADAAAEATFLTSAPDGLSLTIATLARDAARLGPAAAAIQAKRLPLLARAEATWLLDQTVRPHPRGTPSDERS